MCIGCTQQLQQSMPSSGNTDVPPLAVIIPHAIPISIPTLLCFCGNEVAVRVVKKEGRNQGRRFFCCAQLPGRRRCEFFEWHADDSARPFHAGDGSSVFAGTALAPAGLIPEPAQWIPQGSEKPTISNSCTDAAPLQTATSTGSLATDHRGAGMAVNAKRKREARPNFEKELRPTEWNLAELRQVCEQHGISTGGVRKPDLWLAYITKITMGNSCADAPASPCLGLSSTAELPHLGLHPAPRPAHSGSALTQEHAAAVPSTAAAALQSTDSSAPSVLCAHSSVRSREHAAMEKYLNSFNTNPARRAKQAAKMAHEAATKGDFKCLHSLSHLGEKARLSAARGTQGRTPAHSAAREGKASCLHALAELGAGASLSAATTGDAVGGITPAHDAAAGGHEGCLRILHELSVWAIPFAMNMQGCTAAHFAALRGEVGCLRVLNELTMGVSIPPIDAVNGARFPPPTRPCTDYHGTTGDNFQQWGKCCLWYWQMTGDVWDRATASWRREYRKWRRHFFNRE